MGNLEDVDGNRAQIGLGGHFDVAGHQYAGRAGADSEHHGLVIWARVTAQGAKHFDFNAAENFRSSDRWRLGTDTKYGQLFRNQFPRLARVEPAPGPDPLDGDAPDQSDHTRDVIFVWVGDYEKGDPVDPVASQGRGESRRIGSRVHQHGESVIAKD